ncbi:MAG TPA: YdcF family protein [Rhizobiales bacterium]|nr:YdcF family protein [Hyphomicrobiales bacterium]
MLSKVFWIIFRPLNLIALLLITGLALGRFVPRLCKTGGILTGLSVSLLFVFGFTNFPDYLLYMLERPQIKHSLPADPAGIIVLGGGLDGHITWLRKRPYEVNSSADRLITGFELARRFPGIPLVYSGGSGSLDKTSEPGAIVAQRLAHALYGGAQNFILEDKSRNSWENAKFSYRMLAPDNKKPWIVVTSAFHALRAEGVFKRVGFTPVIWPTDFRSEYDGAFRLSYRSVTQLLKSRLALKEFAGIIAYSLMNRMDWPFR